MQAYRRSSHKSKTAFVQNKIISNYQQRRLSKQVCKSINILPIKISHQGQALNESLKTLKTLASSTNLNKQNKGQKSIMKKAKVSLKIQSTSQLKTFLNNFTQKQQTTKIDRPYLINGARRMSHNVVVNHLVNEENPEKMFQKLHNNKDILMFDQNRLIMDTNKFKLILNDFHTHITEIKTDRQNLNLKVNKYQLYFKQMKLKNIPFQGEFQQNIQKNQQLKILNLQKKIQTLNYIIKQYRTNNNQQIKNFQLKLKDFKPNLQKQLTQKLAQTNEKYEQLIQKVQLFQRQCKGSLKISWFDLIKDIKTTRQQIQQKTLIIEDLTQKVSKMSQQISINKQKLFNHQALQQKVLQQSQKLQSQSDHILELKQSMQQKDKKYYQISHLYQQTTFKLQGLKNLQFRIQNKDTTIKKNTILINRLQCQNIQLKTKMDRVLGEFESRVFSDKTLKDNLQHANNCISQLTYRIHDIFTQVTESFGNNQKSQMDTIKQKQHFIEHLFQKIKSSYNEIIHQYQNQLKITTDECNNWKQTFNMISKNQSQKLNYIKMTNQQLIKIQQKKIRCHQSFTKLTGLQSQYNQKDCFKCTHLVVYYGQLDNSYNQIQQLMLKVMKIQSTEPTSLNIQQKTQNQSYKTLTLK